MDKLSAMTTFVAVVDSGSFTRAANALDLPKARVSQRVSDLEVELGVRLLQRSTRTLSLTKDGEIYLERCRQILQDIVEVEDQLKGSAREPSGSIHVDALTSIARWLLAPNLPAFQAKYPGLTIKLASSDRLNHLVEDGIDCAIRGGHLDDTSLVARHVADVTIGLYAAPAYLANSPALVSPDDLQNHRRISWFSPRAAGRLAWKLEQGADQVTIAGNDGFLFEDHDVAIAACLAGAGVCPAAPFAVATYVSTGQLLPVLPAWHFTPRPVHIVYPSRKHLSAKVRCFVDWSYDLIKSSEFVHLTPLALAHKYVTNK